MATFGDLRVLCAVVLLAGAAHATNPTDVATARELYKTGADALDMGDAATAAVKLTQAWALVQTPVIGVDLARAHKGLGHLVEAREAALAVQRLAIAHDETTRSTQARADADKIAAELAPRIPHVKVVVTGIGQGHTATIKLDGDIVPDAALGVARQANPGAHTATADTDDGRHAEATLTLAESETRDLSIVLVEPTAPPKEPVKTAPAIVEVAKPPPPVLVQPERASTSPLLWIGVVTGGVALAFGALTGAFALSEADTVKNGCKTQDANLVFVCGPDMTGHLATANTLGTLSTIGFVTAAVGVALAVTGAFLSTGKHSSAHARMLLPMGIGGSF
jgi:hypothetical protein